MHPLLADLSTVKDAELETKIQELTKKYFMTYNNDLRMQLSVILEDYKEELAKRRAKVWRDQYENRDKGLDKLINVN